ncbi:MAG: hypothetical protein ATN31_06065 [Candidatus Epulonipiscioides saccharophilum]|nr:MAG: hypothetical protein ATN31_06065 [Epulopiscium sp. AS2M-Bin001]
MEKMNMETPNLTDKNIEKIAQLFPSCITEIIDKKRSYEDKLVYKKGINFELLKQLLSEDLLAGNEVYEFSWVGKKQSIIDANKPIRKTLRPCKEDSLNWDVTKNLYIEGDNLEVLKLLQESYLNKIKMIYIDPPYNTGKDSFVYTDDFKKSREEYEEDIELYEDGNRLFKNTDTNGRFHSYWCSMMYARLSVAKNLLTDDGVIFISIDDNELENLKKMCNEIFGEDNFVAEFIRKGSGGRQDSKYYAIIHEYVLCYAKNSQHFISGKQLKTGETFPFVDKKVGKKYKRQLLRKWGENSKRSDRPNLFYAISDPDGNDNFPMLNDLEEGRWRWSKETMLQAIQDEKIEFIKKYDKWVAYEKIYEPVEHQQNTKLYSTLIEDIGIATGAKLIKNIFDGKIFDYPKPVDLIKHIIQLANLEDNDIILDFFSGSATTAHAVMQLNAEDGGNRKFIMVQIPEICTEKTEAYKAGYKNICEIGKERIRRATHKIMLDNPDSQFDGGFRVFKTDSTNMKDVYYSPYQYDQNMLDQLATNIKEDRTALDLLFNCVLEWSLPLDLSYHLKEIQGINVHIYNSSTYNNEVDLIACFDQNIHEDVIRAIAQYKPLKAVFRDSSFVDSPSKINLDEIFKFLSPNTRIKVL